jgi:hypothetical protein
VPVILPRSDPEHGEGRSALIIVSLRRTRDPHEAIRVDGAELGWELHDCDMLQFSCDRAVACTKFLGLQQGGASSTISYREIR